MSLTVCFLRKAALQAREDGNHICIFRILNSVRFPPSLVLFSWLLGLVQMGHGSAEDLESCCELRAVQRVSTQH